MFVNNKKLIGHRWFDSNILGIASHTDVRCLK